jgi:hypothetical protein
MKKNKEHVISVRVDKDMRTALRRYWSRTGETPSRLIQKQLTAFFISKKPKPRREWPRLYCVQHQNGYIEIVSREEWEEVTRQNIADGHYDQDGEAVVTLPIVRVKAGRKEGDEA